MKDGRSKAREKEERGRRGEREREKRGDHDGVSRSLNGIRSEFPITRY